MGLIFSTWVILVEVIEPGSTGKILSHPGRVGLKGIFRESNIIKFICFLTLLCIYVRFNPFLRVFSTTITNLKRL